MVYGLIGEHLSHSYSKTIHQRLGNPGYELLELPPGELGGFLSNAPFKGINVTIPYKEAVIPYCELDETAKAIGSVNTILNREGKLYGYNTDGFGFSQMLKSAYIAVAGKKVIILGSGGTSKTAAATVKAEGAAETVIISRNGENNYGNIRRHADAHILINTTPVGMYPHTGRAPVNLNDLPGLTAVADVIYNPFRTRLLLDAKERGLKHTGGLTMLVAQAAQAHALFFGIAIPELNDIIFKTENQYRNIVLTGMPGCGKTTVGAALAKTLNQPFIDTDHEIERHTKRHPSDIIKTDGEAAFRAIERDIVAKAAARTGTVIATGGGSILLPENRDALAQSGIIYFIDRPLSGLAAEGRPLSVDLPLLYEQRMPLYNSFCDYKIQPTHEGALYEPCIQFPHANHVL